MNAKLTVPTTPTGFPIHTVATAPEGSKAGVAQFQHAFGGVLPNLPDVSAESPELLAANAMLLDRTPVIRTQEVSPFVFLGNNMALDFVNTEVVNRSRIVDLLPTFGDLAAWLRQAGALDAEAAANALRQWSGTPEAARTLQHAVQIRGVLRAMAQSITEDPLQVPEEALETINSLLRRRHGHTQVMRDANGYRRQFHLEIKEPEDLLIPVAEAAGDLLCWGDLSRIHKCENTKCVLYFADTSKNRARRWCSMSVCGNRAKAAAHYRRKRNSAD